MKPTQLKLFLLSLIFLTIGCRPQEEPNNNDNAEHTENKKSEPLNRDLVKIAKVWMYDHNMAALDRKGNLYTWGIGKLGALGLGNNDDKDTPHKVPFPENTKIEDFLMERNFSAAIDKNGGLYTWGKGVDGKLGLGSKVNHNTPQRLEFFSGLKISEIGSSYGGNMAAAIDKMGDVYTWGNGYFGQLGLGDSFNRFSPCQVTLAKKISQMAFGTLHVLALDTEGNLYGWGMGLAIGTTKAGDHENYNFPKKLEFSTNTKIVKIDANEEKSAAIDEKGNLYTWGFALTAGVLGLGELSKSAIPMKVSFPTDAKIVSILMDDNFSAAIDENGNLYTWGSGDSGQLGLGDSENRSSPHRVSFPSNAKIIKISMVNGNMAAIDAEGNLYTWGHNGNGQIGNPDNIMIYSFNVPYQVAMPEDAKIADVVISHFGTAAIDRDGILYTWGKGAIGRAKDESMFVPRQVTALPLE